MKRDILLRVLLACGAVLLTILVLEIAVRALGETDADGQFTFLDYTLPPYVLPLNQLRPQLEHYHENRDRTIFIPDPATGWTYRPKARFYDGLFKINSASMRSLREHAPEPAADSLRIALFGDSFTVGNEVKSDEVWGYHLEKLLMEAGINAEVLNFGVSGYDMGQAFLRWQTQGKDYSPDIVIAGFQPENLDRNVNVFRLLYLQGGIVYSKPRFTLDGDSLALINSPALPPEEIMDVFEAFDSHPLAAYEAYYRGRDVLSPLWKASRLAGLAYAVLNQPNRVMPPQQTYGPDSERGKLGKAIIDAFAEDAAESRVTFIVLHLPRRERLKDYHDNKGQPYQFLLDHFQEAYHFINAEEFLGVEYTDDSYYQPNGHYGPEINMKIAEAIAADLLACIENGSCALPRFQDITQIQQKD